MDLGTIIGLVLGQLLIIGSILIGGSLMTFINPPSIIIVVGGVLSAILTAFPLPQVVNLIKVLKNGRLEVIRCTHACFSVRRLSWLLLNIVLSHADGSALKGRWISWHCSF